MSADFRGKPLDYWIASRTTGDDETRWGAIDAIRHLCSPAESVPLLVDTLRTDSYWRARALAAHGLYDLAWDEANRPFLLSAIQELDAVSRDPSPEVRENYRELFALLQNPEGSQDRRGDLRSES